jgi:hypothetical protein
MLAFRDHPCSWSPDLALTGTSALQLARALLTLLESRQTPRHPDSPHWLQRAAVKRVKHTEAASFTPSSCRLRATSPRSPRSLLRSQLHRTALHRTCPHNAALHCTALHLPPPHRFAPDVFELDTLQNTQYLASFHF